MKLSFMIWLLSLTFISLCKGNLPPVFVHDMNNFVLSELTQIGTVVYQLKGYDPEEGIVEYGIIGSENFKVDPTTGDVTLIKLLDREKQETLSLLVFIKDRINASSNSQDDNIVKVPISVIVLDENDNKPIFLNVPYQINILEDVLPGTTVFGEILATDSDSVGEILDIDCIVEEDSDACFKFAIKLIDNSQDRLVAALVLNDMLDYNEMIFFRIPLLVKDGIHNSTTYIEIRVQDVQNLPPVFQGALSATISEDVPIDTLVMTIKARDGDRGQPRKIAYDLLENYMDYFLLDTKTGELRTARPINREAISSGGSVIKLLVRASEIKNLTIVDSQPSSTTTTIQIKIEDVNDSIPSFGASHYYVSIAENTPKGTTLPLNISVADKDLGINAIFSLRLEDFSEVFDVEPKIVVGSSYLSIRVCNGTLDYENLNHRKFIILLIAEETLTFPKLSSTATLEIQVTDKNDNMPRFDKKSYQVELSESAKSDHVITQVVAKDLDSGRFGVEGIRYSIVGPGSEHFYVDRVNGIIKVATCEAPSGNKDIFDKQYAKLGKLPCLDYETQAEYLLSFAATDDNGIGLSSVVPLRITLMDENDSPPTCDSIPYRASIREDIIAFEPPLYATAHDEDLHSVISYRIVGTSDHFEIDKESGLITIVNSTVFIMQDLKAKNIIFDVEANDGRHSTICKINITISVHDHAPYLFTTSRNYTIEENVPVGTFVDQVRATNMVFGSQIKYYIQSGSFYDFNINSDTGVIITSRKLDYDRRKTYKIIIVGFYSGIPNLSTSITVQINILNINNKLPYFTPAWQRIEVFEDVSVGKLLYTLSAMNSENAALNMLEYTVTKPVTVLNKHGVKITETDHNIDLIKIEKNGNLFLIKPLKIEKAATVRLNISVNDPTAPFIKERWGVFEVSIVNVKKMRPEFRSPWSRDKPFYFFNVIEEQPIGFTLANLESTDERLSESRFELENNGFFEINSFTGLITSKSRIDFETNENITLNASIYNSEASQLFSTVTLFCSIQNINDNSPDFTSSFYTFSILENSPEGTIVGVIHADDLDKDLVEYSIVGDDSYGFEIDSRTGIITVNDSKSLDREATTAISFTGVASDLTPITSRRSSSIQIQIHYLDDNDSIPSFESNIYFAAVDENVAIDPPAAILQVSATDQDSRDAVKYFISSGNSDNFFSLDSDSGVLYPTKSLIGHPGQFSLEIEARDDSGNGHSSFVEIIIETRSINQYKPRFIAPDVNNFSVELSEEYIERNHLVFTVKAEDLDEGNNGVINYHFKVSNENVQETNEFIIDAITGEIRIKKVEHRIKTFRHELTLACVDHGTPIPFESLRLLTIIFLNKQYPTFNETTINLYAPENGARHLRIGKVQANTVGSVNSTLFYFILSGNKANSFYIAKETGDIYTNKSLDREKQSYYDLYVYATKDSNSKSFNDLVSQSQDSKNASICKVHVAVIDLNDNGPIFEKENYYAGISSKASINEFVSKVQAYDKDFGINATIELSISASYIYKYGASKPTGSIVPSPFAIDYQGNINTVSYMAEYSQDLFILEITAKEVQPPERSNKSYVYVWVYEPEQLIRVILSRTVNSVNQEQMKIVLELSNATKSMIIVDEIRYHVDSMGRIRMDWSDLYFHAVDPNTNMILPVANILKTIDAEYDFLKDYYSGLAIENLVPAYTGDIDKNFDSALAALIALFIVVFVGSVSFMVLCCCLKNWIISVPRTSYIKDTLIKKQMIEDLNTTENPLWMEQKLKLYEEQELTMHVFSESEIQRINSECNNISDRRSSNDTTAVENTYATIKPRINSLMGNDLSDYANLEINMEEPTLYEFRGSTFHAHQENA